MTRTISTAVAGLAAACALAGPAAAQEPARVAAVGGSADAAPHVQQAAERDDDAVCSRARRRLWIEGEGWVVRRITTCR